MNRISYTNGQWTGEIFGTHSVIVLKDNDVMYFSTKNTKIDSYDMLKKLVDFLAGECKREVIER
jgi:hypothetical protein